MLGEKRMKPKRSYFYSDAWTVYFPSCQFVLSSNAAYAARRITCSNCSVFLFFSFPAFSVDSFTGVVD